MSDNMTWQSLVPGKSPEDLSGMFKDELMVLMYTDTDIRSHLKKRGEFLLMSGSVNYWPLSS